MKSCYGFDLDTQEELSYTNPSKTLVLRVIVYFCPSNWGEHNVGF